MSRIARVVAVLAAAVALVAALAFTAAFIAILWGDPTFSTAPDVSAEALAKAGISFEQPYPSVAREFTLRDGTKLNSQYLAAQGRETKTSIVLVHGILASSFLLNRPSGLLREALGADNTEVVAIDLRGHGGSGGKPGDVDYIGQYEDDLGDVVRQLRAVNPHGKIILAGHSMGGGVALRYAQRSGLPPVDGYLLFAPYLGWDSPTTRKEPAPSGANADAGAQFLAVHVPRILGLKLLNVFGIRSFNGLRVEFSNLPPELPLRSYSYRAMESQGPADYRAALAAVREPLLVVAGSHDEAFESSAYPLVVKRHSHGAVEIVPEATHESVLHDARTMAAVRAWAQRF